MTTNNISQEADAHFSKVSLRWVIALICLTAWLTLIWTIPAVAMWMTAICFMSFSLYSSFCITVVAALIPPPEPIGQKSAFARRVMQSIVQVRGVAVFSLGAIVGAGMAMDLETWRMSNLSGEELARSTWSSIVYLTGVVFAFKVFSMPILTAVDIYRTPVNIKRNCVARHLRSIKSLGGGCASAYVCKLERLLLFATTGPAFIVSAVGFVTLLPIIGSFAAGAAVYVLINAAR